MCTILTYIMITATPRSLALCGIKGVLPGEIGMIIDIVTNHKNKRMYKIKLSDKGRVIYLKRSQFRKW